MDMLQITIPKVELWDDEKQEFVYLKGMTLQLEHSLVSLSKWESKYCKPFLSGDNKTDAETIDYIKFMTLTQNVDPNIYDRLTPEDMAKISEYINAPMTATTFSDEDKKKHNREIVTAELIYYWMIALTIPFECQKWHLNRLLTLIRVCNIKNAPPKKMSKRELMSRNAQLNAARRQKLNTKG
jgi:hypothetical protein